MRENDNTDDGYTNIDSFKASLFMISFGMLILLFLVAIDRPHWFNMHPISGTANAMSLAAHPEDAPVVQAQMIAAR